MLTGLAGHLDSAQLGQALAAATAINKESARAQVLTGLAGHLDSAQLGQALAAATAITNEYCRAQALTGVARRLPIGLLPTAAAVALSITSHAPIAAVARRARHCLNLTPSHETSSRALAVLRLTLDGYSRSNVLIALNELLDLLLATAGQASLIPAREAVNNTAACWP